MHLIIAKEPKVRFVFAESGRLEEADNFELLASDSMIEKLKSAAKAYLKKEKIPPLPLSSLSPFVQEVLKCTSKIAFGETTTYGEIAKAMDKKGASRAIGQALKLNPYPLFIPCHRVICFDGTLGGFAFGEKIKRELLKFERGYAS